MPVVWGPTRSFERWNEKGSMEEAGMSVTTERSGSRGAGRAPRVLAVLAAAGLGLPRAADAMTADGALITNVASATLYWGNSGNFFPARAGITSQGFTMSYRVTANVLVSCPLVLAQKWVTPTMQA